MKKLIGWLLQRETTARTFELPLYIASALETYTFMQNNARSEDSQITQDDVVVFALAKHFKKNLWTNVIDSFEVVPKVNRREESFDQDVRSLPPSYSQKRI